MSAVEISPVAGMFQPGQFVINKLEIVSVCPVELEQTLRCGPIGTGIGFTTFRIPAAPADGYVTITVEDMQEWIMNWEVRQLMPVPKTAKTIADDIVDLCSKNTLGAGGGGRLGIAIRNESPIAVQVAELRTVQTKLFNDLVNDAQTMFNRQEFRNISDLHRAAARWLKVSVPWLVEMRQQHATKLCPNCSEEIFASALGCKVCGISLPEWYTKFGLDPSVDPAVAEFLRKVKPQQPAAEPVKQPINPPLMPGKPKN